MNGAVASKSSRLQFLMDPLQDRRRLHDADPARYPSQRLHLLLRQM